MVRLLMRSFTDVRGVPRGDGARLMGHYPGRYGGRRPATHDFAAPILHATAR